MDPRKLAEIHNAMQRAMDALTMQYVCLMQRCGVKRIPIHHV